MYKIMLSNVSCPIKHFLSNVRRSGTEVTQPFSQCLETENKYAERA